MFIWVLRSFSINRKSSKEFLLSQYEISLKIEDSKEVILYGVLEKKHLTLFVTLQCSLYSIICNVWFALHKFINNNFKDVYSKLNLYIYFKAV